MQTKLIILTLSHAFAVLLGAFLLRSCDSKPSQQVITYRDTVKITEYAPQTITNIKTKYVRVHDTTTTVTTSHDTIPITASYTAYSDTLTIGNGSLLAMAFTHPGKVFTIPYYKQNSDTIHKQVIVERAPTETRSRFGLNIGIGAGVYRVGEITQVKPGIQLTLGYLIF